MPRYRNQLPQLSGDIFLADGGVETDLIFNHGIDVIILPELCSGCGKCLPPVCPVDCIVDDPAWTASPDDWWDYPGRKDDPYR